MDGVQISTVILAGLVLAATIKKLWEDEKIDWTYLLFIALILIPIFRTLKII